MPKYANTDILEDKETLINLHTRHKGEKERKRIKMLLHLKLNTFRTRDELAKELNISKRTLERWITKYKQEGIAELLSKESRNRESKFINGTIKEELEKRLNSPKGAFTSYVDIQNWLNQEYECDIKYSTLYYFLRNHFKTKLKVPRKSNINKDEQAVAFFKNAEG